MKRITIIILVGLIAGTTPLWAQDVSRVGTGAMQFLKIGAGARACALGEAGASILNEVSSLYWNPAGIASIDKTSMSFSRSQLYADMSHNFVGFVQPLGNNSSIGVSAIFLDSGDMEITTLATPTGTGSYFSWEAYSIGLSYSRFVTHKLQLGGTVKYIREGAYHLRAQTIAIDLGSLLDTGVLGLKLGMGLINFGTDVKLDGAALRVTHERWPNDPGTLSTDAYLKTEKWPLPMVFRMGVSTDIVGAGSQFLRNEQNRLTIAADAYDSNDALMRSNLGIEYEWNDMLALRAGYRGLAIQDDEFKSYDTASYTFGAGLRYDLKIALLQFDYAYTDFQILGTGQQFSITLGF